MRTPAENYAEADRLLDELRAADLGMIERLPHLKAKLQIAHLHAALAQANLGADGIYDAHTAAQCIKARTEIDAQPNPQYL